MPGQGERIGMVRVLGFELVDIALVAALRSAGYGGGVLRRVRPDAKWRCDEMDVVTEALATRDALVELGVA